MGAVSLRPILPQDLDLFFDFQQDAEANWLAAFVSKDPHDRVAFDSHMARVLADPGVLRTVLCDGARGSTHVSRQ